MSQKIRVFHVEDYRIMRDSVYHLLRQDPEIEMVGGVKNGEELLHALEFVEVDVLILDIYLDAMQDLRTMNGFQICRILREKFPDIAVIAHSVYDDADRVAEIFKAGALGFVSKKSGSEELLRGVKSVAKGQKFICPETASKLKNLTEFLSGIEPDLKSRHETFSRREREILELLSQGKTSREIGDHLFISERTVESHRKNMIEKANVNNTVELIAYSYSLGLIKRLYD
jgi:DNA-binding NarL/FixJ family response regulator